LINVGCYVINGSSGKYEYNLCDHLGNVRAVVDDSGELLQQNDYYPFGGVMSSFGGSDNKYLYNGKELQEGTDWLDYGARMYDANLGRFFNKDRFADNYYDLSIYQYAGNNPIKCIDVNGDYIFIIGEDNKRYKYEDGKLYSKNEAGRWIEYIAKEGSYLAIILRHLNILASKKNGKELIDFFMGNSNSVKIKQREKGTKDEGNDYQGWTVTTDRKPKGGIIPTEKGLRRSPLYVALAHEMAHRQDALNRSLSEKIWFKTDDGDGVIEAEKYSTHIENIIRAEHGLPLRTHYARDENEGVGPEIINDGKSCFYKKDGTDYNYRYTPPKKKKSNEKKTNKKS
jgi:RHS repeat-associated protein